MKKFACGVIIGGAAGALVGAAAGTSAALLLTDRTGRERRKDLELFKRDTVEKVNEVKKSVKCYGKENHR